MSTPPRDPRLRRTGFVPADARAAAAHLEAAADAMRAQQLERGHVEEPPTGLLDLAAIRAALGAEDGGEANPDAVRWLAGEPEPEPADPCGFCHGEAEQLGENCEWCGHLRELDEPDPHAHLYFVEGCADCLAVAEAAEAAEAKARAVLLPEVFDAERDRFVPEPEPAPVRAVEMPPAPTEPAEPEASAAPAPVTAVPPSTPAPAPVVVPAVFIPEHSTDRTLNWRPRHDERSRAFGVRRALAVSAPLANHVWPVGPVLDQGAEGACVGAAVADAANTLELAARAQGRTIMLDLLGMTEAARLYQRAQQLDDVPGESYTGTSVLAGMKAGQEQGLWGGYLWAFGTKDVAQAVLQTGPVVIGVPWLSGMYDTGPGGLVVLEGEDTGQGHALAVVGMVLSGPQGQPGPFFVWQNSWGSGYGVGGLGFIHHRDLGRLLRGRGEAAIPTRQAQR